MERVRATLISGDGWAPGMGPWERSSRKPERVSGRAERRRGVVLRKRVVVVVGVGVQIDEARPTRVRRVVVLVNIVICAWALCVREVLAMFVMFKVVDGDSNGTRMLNCIIYNLSTRPNFNTQRHR